MFITLLMRDSQAKQTKCRTPRQQTQPQVQQPQVQQPQPVRQLSVEIALFHSFCGIPIIGE